MKFYFSSKETPTKSLTNMLKGSITREFSTTELYSSLQSKYIKKKNKENNDFITVDTKVKFFPTKLPMKVSLLTNIEHTYLSII